MAQKYRMAPKAHREPKVDAVERVKRILFLKGKNSSQTMNDVMADFSLLAKPHCKVLSRKNDILPFEDPHSLEFLGPKNDCGMFTLVSHSKKRPDNLILGRVFEEHLLDLYEFGVTNFQPIASFPGDKKAFGAKPMMIFLGDQWEIDSTYVNIQNLLLDYFRGFKPEKLSLRGIDHVITCAVCEGVISIRGYFVNYQKANSQIPNLVLKPMGPFMDLTVRRHKTAQEDLWKSACKKPKTIAPKKLKNISRTDKGDKVGRIHMKKQNLDEVGGRRSLALRNRKRSSSDDANVDSGSSNKSSKRPKTA